MVKSKYTTKKSRERWYRYRGAQRRIRQFPIHKIDQFITMMYSLYTTMEIISQARTNSFLTHAWYYPTLVIMSLVIVIIEAFRILCSVFIVFGRIYIHLHTDEWKFLQCTIKKQKPITSKHAPYKHNHYTTFPIANSATHIHYTNYTRNYATLQNTTPQYWIYDGREAMLGLLLLLPRRTRSCQVDTVTQILTVRSVRVSSCCFSCSLHKQNKHKTNHKRQNSHKHSSSTKTIITVQKVSHKPNNH